MCYTKVKIVIIKQILFNATPNFCLAVGGQMV